MRARFNVFILVLEVVFIALVAATFSESAAPIGGAMGVLLKKRTTMTASGTANPLQGDQYEYLPFPALVEFAVLADAGATVNATVFSGTDLLQQASQVDLLAVASPIAYPDHYHLKDLVGAGERINVELQERAAGTPIVRTQVIITRAA